MFLRLWDLAPTISINFSIEFIITWNGLIQYTLHRWG
jgi:hypothetical protein